MLGSEMYMRYYYHQLSKDSNHALIDIVKIEDYFEEHNEYTRSRYTLDDHINHSHVRFAELTRNIRLFRGDKVKIRGDNFTTGEALDMDCMMFGMGCNCFQ